jgi:hypothetical protein
VLKQHHETQLACAMTDRSPRSWTSWQGTL